MVQAYNFLASWQLFPERGTYPNNNRPKSGYYQIATNGEKRLSILHSWVSLENQAFSTTQELIADGQLQPAENIPFADAIRVEFVDSIRFSIEYWFEKRIVLLIVHTIQPNGYLKIAQTNFEAAEAIETVELYHKQLSVLPYAAAVSGAVIRPTEEGVIKHKALTAMEEQTNMQLDQIRQQIELLALQAQTIQKRKELSLMIYEAKFSFKPNIGQVYYLYQKKDDSYTLSLVGPREWGQSGPYQRFVAAVQLLADHTWVEIH